MEVRSGRKLFLVGGSCPPPPPPILFALLAFPGKEACRAPLATGVLTACPVENVPCEQRVQRPSLASKDQPAAQRSGRGNLLTKENSQSNAVN